MGLRESLRGKEEGDEAKPSIQAPTIDMQGEEDGEKKKAPKALDVETHGRMQEE